jgi:rhomboid family GlyGly-CTERM serine protease
MKRRAPFITLVMLAAAVAAYWLPPLANVAVYDRAAIRAGEWWRLITGNWVHFSGGHLGYNLLALGFAGILIETRGYPHFGHLCLMSAAVIGVALFAFDSAMQFYGGLSGMATSAIVYLALYASREGKVQGFLLAAVLVLLGMKLSWEWFAGQPLFATAASPGLRVVPLSHFAGATVALTLFGVVSFRQWLQVSLRLGNP